MVSDLWTPLYVHNLYKVVVHHLTFFFFFKWKLPCCCSCSFVFASCTPTLLLLIHLNAKLKLQLDSQVVNVSFWIFCILITSFPLDGFCPFRSVPSGITPVLRILLPIRNLLLFTMQNGIMLGQLASTSGNTSSYQTRAQPVKEGKLFPPGLSSSVAFLPEQGVLF